MPDPDPPPSESSGAESSGAENTVKRGETIQVAGGERATQITLKLKKQVTRLRCAKIRFNTDSAIMLPSGLPVLVAVIRYVREHPEEKVLLASHTDTQGSDASNLELSKARSKNVYDVLRGSFKDWAEDNERQNSHRDQDVRQLLRWASTVWNFECDPGSVENKALDEPAKKAVQAFKHAFHQRFSSNHTPQEYGAEVDAGFWRRVLNLYGRTLVDQLGVQDMRELQAAMGAIAWLDPDYPWIGCGEKYPLVATADGVDERENRRTEFLFFEADQAPTSGEDGAGLEAVYKPKRYSFTELPCPEPDFFGEEIPSGNVVFVIDYSGSMMYLEPSAQKPDGQPDRIGRARRNLNLAIEALDSGTHFAVLAYNSNMFMPFRERVGETWVPKLVPASDENKTAAQAMVNRLRAGSMTHTYEALERAFASVGLAAGQPKTLKLLSDGAPTRGTGRSNEVQAILQAAQGWGAGWKVDTVGFFEVESPDARSPLVKLLQGLATNGGGSYTPVYVPPLSRNR